MFEGFSLAAGINIADSNFSRTSRTGLSFPAVNSTSANPVLQAEYGYAINDKYLLNAGASRGLGPLVFGTWRGSNIDIKMTDMYSVYLAPGYALNDSTLLYAKLGYLSGTVSDPYSTILPGTGYGVGAKILGGSHVFYQAELLRSEYAHRAYLDATDSFDVNTLTLSVGYKF